MDNPFRETDNKGYTRRRITKHIHSTICVGHHYAQTNTNNVLTHESSNTQLEEKTNRTAYLCGNRNGHHNSELRI